MAIYDELLEEFKEYSEKEYLKILSIFSFLGGMKSSSGASLNRSNIDYVAERAKEILADKAVAVESSEIETVLSKIFKSALSNPIGPKTNELEEVINRVIETIGVRFLVDRNSIFYMANISARRLSVLITFEISLLESIIDLIDDLAECLWNQQERQERGNITSEIAGQSYSNYFASKSAEAHTYIGKVEDAVLEGKLNPTSVQAFEDIVDSIFNDSEVDKFIRENNRPDEIFKRLLLRMAYANQIHGTLVADLSKWSSIVDEFDELNLPTLISKGLLHNINGRMEYWKDYFLQVDSRVKFTQLREYLTEIATTKEVMSSVFSSPDPTGTIQGQGITNWVDDADGDQLSPMIQNPWPSGSISVEVGDIFGFHSPTIDESSGNSVAYHKVTGYNSGYIHFSPEIQKPPRGTILSYVKFTGGSDYYGKYQAIARYLPSYNLPSSLDLHEFHQVNEVADMRKLFGMTLQSFMEDRSLVSLGVDRSEVTEFEARKDDLQERFTTLLSSLEDLQDVMIGYNLPQIDEFDWIDDTLEEHGLNELKKYFVSGDIKNFFSSLIPSVTKEFSIITKINSLLKLVT